MTGVTEEESIFRSIFARAFLPCLPPHFRNVGSDDARCAPLSPLGTSPTLLCGRIRARSILTKFEQILSVSITTLVAINIEETVRYLGWYLNGSVPMAVAGSLGIFVFPTL